MWRGTFDVHHVEEIDSTNAEVRRRAARGAPDGLVVVAGHQSAGRGRLDRRWESPPGASLLVSVLVRPDLEDSQLHLCTVALALAALDAARRSAGVATEVKWPNDLMVGPSKLGGILAEVERAGPAGRAVVVGLGLNVAWPGPVGAGGTGLEDEAGHPVDRAALLHALLDALADRRPQLESEDGRRRLVDELRRSCSTVGRAVRVELFGEEVTGRATGIDDSGHLLVETPGGLRTFAAGDVVHLRPG